MAGVYKITNLKTNDLYIGGTTQSFISRIRKHFSSLKNQCHENSKLQESFNEFGKDVLHFEILEECSKENVFEREQYWIETFSPFYNINKKVIPNKFGYKLSEEFCQKMTTIRTNTLYKILEISTNRILYEINLKKFCIDNNLNMVSLQQTFEKGNCKRKYFKHKNFKIIDKFLIDDFIKEYLESKNI